MGALSLDQQITSLEHEYEAACSDTAADMGEDAVDNGGWIELARAVVELAGPEINAKAKSEFLRMQGL